MRTLDRYIGSRLAKGYLLVMLILVSVFSLMAFVDELDELGKGHYQMVDALAFVALTLPQRMLNLVSITALLGSIIALGSLAGANELLAMRAAGVSGQRIGWSVIKTGTFLMLAAAIFAEFVVPPLDQRAQSERSLATSARDALRTAQGFWSRKGLRFINVRDVLHGRIPADIDIYEFDHRGRLRIFIHAQKAEIIDQRQWLLEDVDQKFITEQAITLRHLDALPWGSFLNAAQIGIIVLPPESLSLSNLYLYVRGLKDRGQNADRYELALWQKLSIPLATGVMVLLAIPFVFGPLGTASTGYRILLGSIVGIGFYLLNQITGQLGLLIGLNPVLTVVGPLAVMLSLAVWLFRRVD